MANSNIVTQKIKAFTIVELIVVFIISSILIYAVLAIFTKTEKLFAVSFKDSFHRTEILMFSYIIEEDIRKAENISSRHNELNIETYKNSIIYNFEDEYIIRNNQSQIDTFAISILDFDTKTVSRENGQINQIEFSLPDIFGEEVFVYTKKYSRCQRFNSLIENR